MKFAHPLCLWLVPFVILAGAGLFFLSRRIATRRLAGFGPAERIPRILNSVNRRAKIGKFWMVVGSLCLLVLVLARPMVGPRSKDADQSGAEFFIILDVSKSMLVRDVPPNRLEAVKASLEKWLKTRHGDRIGLILMAGDAFVQAPLTNDYTALREVLAQSGPLSLSRGGTNLDGAIQIAATAFKKSGVKNKAIVLISDGESQEGNASEAARNARTNDKITIFTIGVGTEDGGPVPDVQKGKPENFNRPPPAYVKDEYGVQARSRLDERALRAIATAGGGRYFHFNPDDDVWNALYTQALQPLARHMEIVDLKDYDDFFQIPLFLAVMLLGWELAVSTRLKNPLRPKSAVILPEPGSAPAATRMKTTPNTRSTAAVLLLFLLALTGSTATASELLTMEQAERMVKEGKSEEAAKSLWSAAQLRPDDPYLMFNYGIAAYASGKFNDAIYAFSEVSTCKDNKLRALALTHLGDAQYRLGKSLRNANNGEGAIVAWERSVEYYETSIKERGNRIAAHNLEIAKEDLEKTYIEVGSQALDRGRKIPELGQRINVLGGAFDKFEKAVGLAPTNTEAIMKREEARRLLSDSLRNQARELRAQAAKADVTKDKGKERERLNLKASEEYAQAIAVNPKDAELAGEHEEFKKTVSNDFADSAEAAIREADNLADDKKGRENRATNKQRLLAGAVASSEKALGFDENNARAKALNEKALTELEKALVDRADFLQEKGDETALKDVKSGAAANQYQGAMEDYQKALDIKPDDAHAKEQLAGTQAKLAAQLTKSGENEMKQAESTVESVQPPQNPPQQSPFESKSEAPKLQEAIGHLEKASQTLGQAELLAPGKNNAAALQKKATDQLDLLRTKLETEMAKNEAKEKSNDSSGKGDTGEGKPGEGKPGEGKPGEGKPGEGKPGEGKPGEGKPGEGPAPQGGEGMATAPPKDGNQKVGAKFGGGKAPLNFSEIRGSSEQEGQFVDKTKKESIRDW